MISDFQLFQEAHILAAESSTESGPSLPSSKTSNNEPAIPSSPVLSTLPSSSDSTVAPPVTAPLSPPPTPSPRTVPVSAVRLVVKPQARDSSISDQMALKRWALMCSCTGGEKCSPMQWKTKQEVSCLLFYSFIDDPLCFTGWRCLLRGVVEKLFFTIRLTIRVDPLPPPLTVRVLWFFQNKLTYFDLS